MADDDAGGPRGLRHAPAIARLLLEGGHDRALRHLADREHVPDVDLRAHLFLFGVAPTNRLFQGAC